MEQENSYNKESSSDLSSNQKQADIKTVQIVNNIKSSSNKKISKKLIVCIIIELLVIVILVSVFIIINKDGQSNSGPDLGENNNQTGGETNSETKKPPYWISSNSLESFDLYFLQSRNEKKNKIYSPISIKYALKMLEEGTTGNSKNQISNIIGDYVVKKYVNSNNMSFANAFFVNSLYESNIKDSYKNTLINKYDAEVKLESFATPDAVNSWVSDKTLGLIDNSFDDISQKKFLLINALAIDMDWKEKFILYPRVGYGIRYSHENFSCRVGGDVYPGNFKDSENKVSGMEIAAAFNNYDIVNVLGEENIRKTVRVELEKYLQKNPWAKEYVFDGYNTDLSDDVLIEKYLDKYIEEIDSNYKSEFDSTDFSFYVDNDIKVFAKDLKEYDGTTLQYISIMPINEDLDSYINKITSSDINSIIGGLKELKAENFKEGVVTEIEGFIPKFKFEYDLDLMGSLKELGITDVFELGKAGLTNISSDESLFVETVKQKSTIEFTQDGIKAAAITSAGGAGGGKLFDYYFDVPIEKIDLTFDKPYMFIIRDKNSGDVWFVGSVYSPLLYSEDNTKISNREIVE